MYPDIYNTTEQVPCIMFTTFTDRMLCKQAAERKLEEYRKSDLREKNKRGTKSTLTIEEAMHLIEETEGNCSCCGCKMIMHSWPKKPENTPSVFATNGFAQQFSFDRIKNDGTHSADNVRVVCLECNIKLADLEYAPDYFVPAHKGVSGTAYEKYEFTKIHFNEFEDSCIKGKNRKYIGKDVWNYHRTLKSYLAYLHDLIYGTRKTNNWKKFGIVATDCRCSINVGRYLIVESGRSVPFTQVNFDYYVREKLGMSEAEIDAEEQAAIEAAFADAIDYVESELA